MGIPRLFVPGTVFPYREGYCAVTSIYDPFEPVPIRTIISFPNVMPPPLEGVPPEDVILPSGSIFHVNESGNEVPPALSKNSEKITTPEASVERVA
jgi:hypothetical protein